MGVTRARRNGGRLDQSPSGGRRVRRAAPGVRSEEYARACLSRLARILVHCGYSPRKLSREFHDICRALKEPARPLDPTIFTYFFDLPHIMSYWYSDPEYLDRRAAPIPLPLRGRSPTLTALVERVLPGEDPASVAQALVHFEAVRRHKGLYIPLQRYLAFSHTSGRVHGLNALLGMLRTVEHNLASPRASRILERSAMNPNYPVNLLPLFHRWVKKFADKLLKNADNYMQLGEGRDKKGPRVRLGLSIFAYETPVINGPLAPQPSREAGRRDPARRRGAAHRKRSTDARKRGGGA
jgi:Family of unknown function (DUF6502)